MNRAQLKTALCGGLKGNPTPPAGLDLRGGSHV
jgi:hypothetical protein